MKAFSFFLFLLFLLRQEAVAFSPADLKSGDLILQSNPCFLCQLIEEEENSAYSHMGVVIRQPDGEPIVLESWGYVQNSPLPLFLAKRKSGTSSLVLRALDQFQLDQVTFAEWVRRYQDQFAGRGYDPFFLWNNRDQNGELFYCSEFAAKFLNPFLGNRILTKAMHYEKNREAWLHYFRGTPPDGKPGISPGDFERSTLFKKVGSL